MTKLAESYFRLRVDLDSDSRRQLVRYLEDRASACADGLFGQEVKFYAYAEEGSVRAWLVVAGAIYIGIGQYGSFRSGLDYLIHDARTFTERVRQELLQTGAKEEQFVRTERRLGVPGKLQRLIDRIEVLGELGEGCSKLEYEHEKQLIISQAKRIIKQVDSERDYQVIRPVLPAVVRSELPERLPATPDRDRFALRPEELEMRTAVSMIEAGRNTPAKHGDRFLYTEDAARLISDQSNGSTE